MKPQGFDCSTLEPQKLAWFLSAAIRRAVMPGPIRLRYDGQNRISAYLTTPEAAADCPASEEVSRIIDGFRPRHGLKPLATVDRPRREAGIPMKAGFMTGA